jgi:hypothetical protein
MPATTWTPGDAVTFTDRFRRVRTGFVTGSEVSTTRLTGAGVEVRRATPVTFVTVEVEPHGRPGNPGHGAHRISIDGRKLAPATPAELAASPMALGWADAQAREAAWAACWQDH